MSLEIDWSSAEVHGGDVTVALAGKVSKRFREILDAEMTATLRSFAEPQARR